MPKRNLTWNFNRIWIFVIVKIRFRGVIIFLIVFVTIGRFLGGLQIYNIEQGVSKHAYRLRCREENAYIIISVYAQGDWPVNLIIQPKAK